ncbi:cadherin repeat domain-containing protein [Vibrio sp. AK197]
MNSANISQIMLATIIIDVNGQIRTLAAGEQPRPGEVVFDLGEDLTNGNNIDVQLVEPSGENVNITLDNEIAQLLEQIEAGEDPTQNPDLATAAGGQNGSSPTASGAIERTGAETLATTSFDTTGLESQGLSETQSLALLDLIGETLITSSGDTVINYFENSSVDTVLAIVDLAEFEGIEQSFSLQFEAGDPLADYFVINEAGEIRFTQAGVEAFTNDFEAGPNSHALTVTVTAVNGQEQTVNITLQELDVNEAPVFTLPQDDNDNGGDDNNGETDSESPGFVFEYSENSSTDDIIGQVAASDPDAGDSVTYSIIDNVVNSDDEPLYEIDSITGEISLTQAGVDAFTNDFEDVEGKNNHQILVGASDGELTTEIIVNLNENDVNEAPTFVDNDDGTVNAYTFEYNENSLYIDDTPNDGLNDNKIGQVIASDPDAGDTVTYSIIENVVNSDDEPLYEIDSITGEISLTQAGVDAFTNDFEDVEGNNNHQILVGASDGELTTEIIVNLNEKDVNEAPTFVDNDDGTVNAYTFEYNENSLYVDETPNDGLNDNKIGQVIASDPDAGDSVTYSIIDNVVNSDDEPLYEIDSETGEISLTQAGVDAFTNDFEDVEGKNNHQILVGASDGELTTEIIVNLNENDVNEAPIFVDDNDETVNAYTFEYNENSLYIDDTPNDGLNDNKIGQVIASDPDAGDSVTYSIIDNVVNSNDEPLYEIDAITGEISLTQAGVDAFTNDFEDVEGNNNHQILVGASDGELTTEIIVNLNENDVNEAPTFVDNDDETVNAYTFEYNENSLYVDDTPNDGLNDNKIGQVIASDPDAGDSVTYSIIDNVVNSNDEPLYEIDSITGEISLTQAGVDAFTNDFEDVEGKNNHQILVGASDGELTTNIIVNLNENDVNEAPIAEDFSVDVDIEASTQIIFDSDNSDYDFISDVEDDILENQVMVMLTSLPDYGTLYYTEGEVTREITSADLYSTDGSLATQFDPNFITYQIDDSDKVTFVFGDNGTSTTGEWGVATDGTDTKRTLALSNGNEIMFWITDQNGSPDHFELYENNNGNDGYGLADDDGNGINGNGGNGNSGHETFHIDLGGNPIETVEFGIDGLGGGHNENSANSVLVTYYLASGATETVEYQKDPGDTGNSQLYYEFSYSSPDDPVIFMEMIGDGGNWVLRYLSGEEIPPSETSFDYVAVDSGQTQTGDPSDPTNDGPQLVSEEATVTLNSGDNTYNIVFAANGDSLNGQLGNDVLVGDDQANVFAWLDSTLDNGRDVIVDFESGKDKLDLLDILSDGDGAEDLAQMLVTNLSVNGDNVELTVDNSGGDTQTIVFEDGATIFSSYISNDTIQASELLDNILKEPS